jgi:hypothetical protein
VDFNPGHQVWVMQLWRISHSWFLPLELINIFFYFFQFCDVAEVVIIYCPKIKETPSAQDWICISGVKSYKTMEIVGTWLSWQHTFPTHKHVGFFNF